MTGESLRQDVIDVLEARAETRLMTVLNRSGKGVHFTGTQLRAAAEEMLARLQNVLGAGPHVLIAALPAGEDFLFALVASLIGENSLVPVALPRVADPHDRLHRMAITCEATAVLCLERNRDAIVSQTQGACPVLVLDAPDASVFPPRFSSLKRTAEPQSYPIIQHTSGSTRFPKAVPVGAAQIRANCEMIRALWGMNHNTVMVNWLPHYHDMGLMGCILYPLLCGAYSVQMNPFDMIRSPLSWLQAVSAYRGTISGGPAFAFQECLTRIKQEESKGLDLRSWDCAFCGAEPIPAGLLSRFAERFAPNGLARRAVFACYGMAECTLFAAGEPSSVTAPAPQETDFPKAWQAMESCLLSPRTRRDLCIADPNTLAPMPDGSEGEILLSGDSLGSGYLALPEETAKTFVTDGDGRRWLRTGDLGGIVGERLVITGRSKDVVIVNGRNVAAAEIEWTAAQEAEGLNPSAAAAFVPVGGENGHAVLFIEWRPGASMNADTEVLFESIRRSVLSRCGVALDNVRLLRRGALPRTTSGKIRRAQVRSEYASQVALMCEGPD